jgi:hypothetical protein
MNRRLAAIAVLVGAMLSVAGCETPTATSGRVVVRDRDATVAVVFSDRDRVLISDYFAHQRKSLPPGLAKRSTLPPGLQRQLERNGHLPPGLEGRSLPGDLEARLSRLPEPYVRVVVGADVVLMNARTRIVVDILRNVAD